MPAQGSSSREPWDQKKPTFATLKALANRSRAMSPTLTAFDFFFAVDPGLFQLWAAVSQRLRRSNHTLPTFGFQ